MFNFLKAKLPSVSSAFAVLGILREVVHELALEPQQSVYVAALDCFLSCIMHSRLFKFVMELSVEIPDEDFPAVKCLYLRTMMDACA